MTAADWIAEQRRIEQAATEGPWDTSTTSWAPEARMVDVPDGDDEMSLAWEAGGGLCVMSRANAEFIADARTALPKALDALEAVLALHQPVKIYAQADEFNDRLEELKTSASGFGL